MSRVAVTGATGFIGSHCASALARAGHEVVAVGRDPERVAALRAAHQTVASDNWKRDRAVLVDAMRGCATLLHLADDPRRVGTPMSSSPNLARAIAAAAADAGVKRVVFSSSIYARPDLASVGAEYGASKRSAEQVLLERTDLRSIILRLPPVYGPRSQGGVTFLAQLIKRGIPLPVGLARAPRDYLSIDNLTSLITTLVRLNDDDFARLANFPHEPSDGQPISTAELSRAIAEALGRRIVLLPVPPMLLKIPAKFAGMQEQFRAAFEPLLARSQDELMALSGWRPNSDQKVNLAYLRETSAN